MQLDINSTQIWCTADSTKLNVCKTKVTSFSRKTEVPTSDYKCCQFTLNRTNIIKGMGIFIGNKLHLHNHINRVYLILLSCWYNS
jgi:hypothetical protein